MSFFDTFRDLLVEDREMRENTRGPSQDRSAVDGGTAGAFLGEFGGYMVPGTGVADAGGRYPALTDPEQAYYPGLVDNLRQGDFGMAAGQGMGLLGDALYTGGGALAATGVGAPAGGLLLGAGAIAKAPRAAQKAAKAVSAAGDAVQAAKGAGRTGRSARAQKASELADLWKSRGIKSALSERDSVITLNRIEVPEGSRNRGLGSSAMRELTDYADETGKTIALSPSADFGGSKKRLEQFYKRFGFAPNKGRARDLSISETMVRQPTPRAPAPDLGAAYRGMHTAPGHGGGAPMHDVTRGIYPDDFYGPMGLRYYGVGDGSDARVYDKIRSVRGKPAEVVNVWRAVPKDAPEGSRVLPGDWVTPSRRYAVEHGESVFGRGGYRIIKDRKPAEELLTDGNSMLEWGWNPTHPGYRANRPPAQGLLDTPADPQLRPVR